MEFEEIEFWMVAVADHNRAIDAAMRGHDGDDEK
jgi:hypothetical protein